MAVESWEAQLLRVAGKRGQLLKPQKEAEEAPWKLQSQRRCCCCVQKRAQGACASGVARALLPLLLTQCPRPSRTAQGVPLRPMKAEAEAACAAMRSQAQRLCERIQPAPEAALSMTEAGTERKLQKQKPEAEGAEVDRSLTMEKEGEAVLSIQQRKCGQAQDAREGATLQLLHKMKVK